MNGAPQPLRPRRKLTALPLYPALPRGNVGCPGYADAGAPLDAWRAYLEALQEGIKRIAAYAPDVVVVSLGVDTYKDDPISHFKLEHEHFTQIGALIKTLGKPMLFVMEGGHAVAEIGINAVNVLTGFEGA